MKHKIGLISEHASPLALLGGVDSGGQNVYVGELAKQLALQGYEIDIFTRWDNARLPQIVPWSQGVRVVHVKAGPLAYVRKEDLLPYMDEFTEELLAFEPGSYDLFHANFWMSGLVAAEIKRLTGIPFVITFHALGKVRLIHQGASDQFPAERTLIEERIVQEADQIIAECPQDQEDLITYYNADPDRITIIPCGVNPQDFHPIDKQLARTLFHMDTDDPLILQLGRMVPRKGVDNVIQATEILNRKYNTPAKLIVVGGDSSEPDPIQTPEIGNLSRLAEQLGIAHKVTFVGSKGRDVLKYYYSAADVFVSTPWYEPFGITPLEAMACGTPVIGANVGGIKYSVVDGETGYLVPPKNPEELANKLHHLLSNQELAETFQQNALNRVNTEFTWAKVAQSVAQLYERVIPVHSNGNGFSPDTLTAIDRSFESAIETFYRSRESIQEPILEAAQAIQNALADGHTILVCGNGGSASQAQHFAGELVGRFQMENRPALPAISLTADSTILTAWANDFGYDEVFARQVEAYGHPGDILIGISTSGNSASVNKAFDKAHDKGMTTIALLGKSGGEAAYKADIVILVPSDNTPRIQELHIHILHLLCELVETNLYLSETYASVEAVLA